ncbi:MAG: SH3 domain-containing protein [Nitrospinae bacterium]|nr:SH3 domain-containing protein [Nitrospinota bacterium]
MKNTQPSVNKLEPAIAEPIAEPILVTIHETHYNPEKREKARLMKNILAALAIAIAAFTTASFAGQTLMVTIKQVSIRADKQFFAKAVAEAKYQDRLEVIKQQGDWYQVTFKGVQGWVHKSSVGEATKGSTGSSTVASAKASDGDPTLAGKGKVAPGSVSGQASSKVSDEDVALAGKGFNSQVEGDYKKKNPNLNFAAVDSLEKISVSDKDAAEFMKAGHLSPKEVKK